MSSRTKVAIAAVALFFSGVTTGATGAFLFANNSFNQTLNREVTRRAGGTFKERMRERLSLTPEQSKLLDDAIADGIKDSWELRAELRARFLQSLESLRPHLTEAQQESLNQLQENQQWQRRRSEQGRLSH